MFRSIAFLALATGLCVAWPTTAGAESMLTPGMNNGISHGRSDVQPNRYYFKVYFKLLDSKKWSDHGSAYRSLKEAKDVAEGQYGFTGKYNLLVVRFEVGTNAKKIVYRR